MRIRYLDWKASAQSLEERLRFLERLFSYLLVREDGDVDRALEILEFLGERHGLFDDELSLEDFKKHLLQKKLVQGGPSGFALTPRGERFILSQTASNRLQSRFASTGNSTK